MVLWRRRGGACLCAMRGMSILQMPVSVRMRQRRGGMASAKESRVLTTRTPLALSQRESSSTSAYGCSLACMYSTYGASEGACSRAEATATCTSWTNLEWRARMSETPPCGLFTHMNHAVVGARRS